MQVVRVCFLACLSLALALVLALALSLCLSLALSLTLSLSLSLSLSLWIEIDSLSIEPLPGTVTGHFNKTRIRPQLLPALQAICTSGCCETDAR